MNSKQAPGFQFKDLSCMCPCAKRRLQRQCRRPGHSPALGVQSVLREVGKRPSMRNQALSSVKGMLLKNYKESSVKERGTVAGGEIGLTF